MTVCTVASLSLPISSCVVGLGSLVFTLPAHVVMSQHVIITSWHNMTVYHALRSCCQHGLGRRVVCCCCCCCCISTGHYAICSSCSSQFLGLPLPLAFSTVLGDVCACALPPPTPLSAAQHSAAAQHCTALNCTTLSCTALHNT